MDNVYDPVASLQIFSYDYSTVNEGLRSPCSLKNQAKPLLWKQTHSGFTYPVPIRVVYSMYSSTFLLLIGLRGRSKTCMTPLDACNSSRMIIPPFTNVLDVPVVWNRKPAINHHRRYLALYTWTKLHNKLHVHEDGNRIEPPHDKSNKMSVRPAKTQISLGIRPVWSDSSLCAQWVAKDPSFLHADTEVLIRLAGCTGWSESSLGAQPHCWFCHETATGVKSISYIRVSPELTDREKFCDIF